jgi:hypothetical protein
MYYSIMNYKINCKVIQLWFNCNSIFATLCLCSILYLHIEHTYKYINNYFNFVNIRIQVTHWTYNTLLLKAKRFLQKRSHLFFGLHFFFISHIRKIMFRSNIDSKNKRTFLSINFYLTFFFFEIIRF